MERIDDLGVKNLKLIQNTDLFCFGTDAVLLSSFATVKPKTTVVDLCSGNGIIPVLLSGKTRAKKIIGVEIQKESFDLAQRSAEINNISDRVSFINCDAKEIKNYLPSGCADVITCNPPYMSGGWGFISPSDKKAIARHEITINIDDVAKIAAYLLKCGGYFCMVHRAERLCDVICSMRKYKIEPKRIRFVHSYQNSAPKLFLIEGMSGARAAAKILEPLVIYNDNGDYTDEVKRLYKGEN